MTMKSFYVALNATAGRVGLAQVAGKVDVMEDALYRASRRRTASWCSGAWRDRRIIAHRTHVASRTAMPTISCRWTRTNMNVGP